MPVISLPVDRSVLETMELRRRYLLNLKGEEFVHISVLGLSASPRCIPFDPCPSWQPTLSERQFAVIWYFFSIHQNPTERPIGYLLAVEQEGFLLVPTCQ